MMLLLQAIHLRHNWLTRNRGGENLESRTGGKNWKKTYSKNRPLSLFGAKDALRVRTRKEIERNFEKKNDKMSENESLDIENDTFEGGESREIANTTTTLATTTLLNNQQVDTRTLGYSRVKSANGECVEP